MSREKTLNRLLPALAALLVLTACQDTVRGTEFAEPAVQKWRDQINAGQFEQAFDATSEEFKRATSRETGIALFSAVDRKLGKLQKTERISWNVNTQNLTTMVTLVYNSRYADGQATETFVVKVDDGHGEIIGYNIQSLDMIIK